MEVVGEIRQGVEREVAAALGLADDALSTGRHVLLAGDEHAGRLLDPLLVSGDPDDPERVIQRRLTHERVVEVARRENVEFADGVTYDRANDRIFLRTGLEAERVLGDGVPMQIGVFRPGFEEVAGIPAGPDATVAIVARVDRDGRIGDPAAVVSRDGAVRGVHVLQDEEVARLARAEALDLADGVHVDGGHVVVDAARRFGIGEILHAIEDGVLPGSGELHRLLEVATIVDAGEAAKQTFDGIVLGQVDGHTLQQVGDGIFAHPVAAFGRFPKAGERAHVTYWHEGGRGEAIALERHDVGKGLERGGGRDMEMDLSAVGE